MKLDINDLCERLDEVAVRCSSLEMPEAAAAALESSDTLKLLNTFLVYVAAARDYDTIEACRQDACNFLGVSYE